MNQAVQSRDTLVREDEFRVLLERQAGPLGAMVAALVVDPSPLGAEGPLARLGNAADELETFLDDYGARENRTFVTFGELVACVRGLARIRSVGMYLVSRLPRYSTVDDNQALIQDLKAVDETLRVSLESLCRGLLEEAQKLGFEWRAGRVLTRALPALRRLLPRNLDTNLAVDQRQHIAELGSRFMAVLKASRQLGLEETRPQLQLPAFVAMHATEERCRWYESAVHNIQSMYDTYVASTPEEGDHPWLRTLRGHASVARHLLEMATGLVHFYERHENDLRHELARERVASLVSKTAILNCAVNSCLRFAYLYVEACAGVAERVIEVFASQQMLELALPAGISLHARPLALIVQVARHYRTPLDLELEGEPCSALSLMGLIMLAGRHPRPSRIRARGDVRALHDLRTLFECGLGESGNLPESLSYLRTGG